MIIEVSINYSYISRLWDAIHIYLNYKPIMKVRHSFKSKRQCSAINQAGP